MLQGPTCHYSPGAGVTHVGRYAWLSHGCRDLNSSPRADAATVYQLNRLPNPFLILRQVFTKLPGQGLPALISLVAEVTGLWLSIFYVSVLLSERRAWV